MNNDLISRKALLERIREDAPWWWQNFHSFLIVDMIKDAPGCGAEPVRHGKWFFDEYDYFTCSVCGGQYFTDADSTKDAKAMLENNAYYPYCPYCGAKMDGGNEDG